MLIYLATIATASALASNALPTVQILKMWRSRSAGGVSTVWVVGAFCNGLIWTAYSLMLGNVTLILPTLLGLCMNGSMTAIILLVRHPRYARAAVDEARRAVHAAIPAQQVERLAKAVVHDPELAAEFRLLVAEHEAERLSTADTLVLRPLAGTG
jgi:uncharacterized protein with PQ loop repeat